METILTVFRNRLRDDLDGYQATADDMLATASALPGFMSFKQFVADDGERVAVIEFDTWEHHETWAKHPDHRVAQQRGRAEWYAEYRIQVCRVLSERNFGQ
jgi:heme-degrading monooxygenase HmoA